MNTPPSTPAVGRNDPCPCGSGKKVKKCCEGAERHNEERARAIAERAERAERRAQALARNDGNSVQPATRANIAAMYALASYVMMPPHPRVEPRSGPCYPVRKGKRNHGKRR